MTEGAGVTYRPTLTAHRRTYLHHSLMGVDGYGVSGSSHGTNVCYYGMGTGCYCVRVQSQFGLGSRRLATTKQRHVLHTLKI